MRACDRHEEPEAGCLECYSIAMEQERCSEIDFASVERFLLAYERGERLASDCTFIMDRIIENSRKK